MICSTSGFDAHGLASRIVSLTPRRTHKQVLYDETNMSLGIFLKCTSLAKCEETSSLVFIMVAVLKISRYGNPHLACKVIYQPL